MLHRRLAMLAAASLLCVVTARGADAKGMLSALLADHEAVIQTLRGDLATAMDKLSDAGTNDFLTGLMEKHEKMAWMLRAFVEA
jgi:starvation-inducible DNA-binding protein